MSATMSFAGIVQGLVAQGVPRHMAEIAAGREMQGLATIVYAAPEAIIPTRATITFPLRFTLPWSALVSDNRKYSAVYTKTNRPKLILTPEYREAKRKARGIVQGVVGNASPVSIPLQLHAKVWVPDNRPGHDVANFAKCCHDAFQDVIYTKDDWLHKIIWERAGVSVDAPHVSIEIREFSAARAL